MNDSIDSWAEAIKNYTPLDKARDLFHQLEINRAEIEKISESIKKAEDDKQDAEILQHLYMNEFHLLMDNVGLFEDVLLNLNRVKRTPENEFELARIRREAPKLCLVPVLELNDDNN